MEKTTIIFDQKERKLPHLSRKVRLLFLLYSFPVIGRFPWFKQAICRELKIPLTTNFGKKFYCSSGNLHLGRNVNFADTFILDYAPVYIGNNVSFSYKNMLITSTHNLANFSEVIAKPITIGDNVWITTGVTILPGVSIGSNSVIGAGSVVTKDIPAGVFAAGNPCVKLKDIAFKR